MRESTSAGSRIIRVLIVDDDEAVRRGIKAIIRHESDMDVVGEAENGSEEIELARTLLPDVILMDVLMPGVNGMEASAKILQTNPSVKILMLSQYGGRYNVHRARESGVAGYFSKNLTLRDLLNAIRTAASNV